MLHLLGGPSKLLCLLHQLVQGNCLLAQPTKESAERREATDELMHLLQGLGLLHALYCGYLLGVAFDSSLGNEKPQELAGLDSKHTLLRVEIDLISSQICEGLSEVVQQCDS